VGAAADKIRCLALAPQIKNPDKGPELRTGHSVVVTGLPNNPKAVIIGGCTSTALVNDVWNLKLGAESLEWERPKIGQPDSAPSPRWRHTATLLRASASRPRASRPRLLWPLRLNRRSRFCPRGARDCSGRQADLRLWRNGPQPAL
jgi:hypothetical protein